MSIKGEDLENIGCLVTSGHISKMTRIFNWYRRPC